MNKRIVAYEINQFYKTLGTVCPKYKGVSITACDLEDRHALSDILYSLEDNGAIELCHKVRHLRDRHRAIKTIGVILMIVGFILTLGTAGASDLNTIPFLQIIAQLIMSLSVTTLGFIIIKKMEA